MFFHIFKNSFIIGPDVPNEIRINNQVTDELMEEIDPDKILDYLSEHDSDKITFYTIKTRMMNSTIKTYCMYMGLDYNAYIAMADHARLYTNSVIKIYEPEYDDKYKNIDKRTWSYSGKNIKWNIGQLPFEYLINHVFYDDYASSIYFQMKENYKEEERLSAELSQTKYNPNIDYMNLKTFIDNPYNNMAFNDEFISFYFNKRLMNYLRKIKYTLPDMKSNIENDLVEEFNKAKFEGKTPDYDNKLINEDILAR